MVTPYFKRSISFGFKNMFQQDNNQYEVIDRELELMGVTEFLEEDFTKLSCGQMGSRMTNFTE